MEQLSNRALISRLYSSADNRVNTIVADFSQWESWYEAVQDLTDAEKMVYIIVKMNQSVTNGGFIQYFEDALGIFAPETEHALNLIQAAQSAQIMHNAIRTMNPIDLVDKAYKSYISTVSISDQQRSLLVVFDQQYDALDGQENLEDLLGNYLQELIKAD